MLTLEERVVVLEDQIKAVVWVMDRTDKKFARLGDRITETPWWKQKWSLFVWRLKYWFIYGRLK